MKINDGKMSLFAQTTNKRENFHHLKQIQFAPEAFKAAFGEFYVVTQKLLQSF